MQICTDFPGLNGITHLGSALPPESWGPFFEGPETFLHPDSHSKISNLMITELFYLHLLNMNEVLFIQEVQSGVYSSPFLDTDELKMALRARKVSGAFEKRVCNIPVHVDGEEYK